MSTNAFVSFNQTKHRVVAAFATVSAAMLLTLAPVSAATNLTISSVRDESANSVIKGGALSSSELLKDYQTQTYVQHIYSYFHITSAEITSLGDTAAVGSVAKTGVVSIDKASTTGQPETVAVNAVTAGRDNIAGSKVASEDGSVFYVRTPSVSFLNSSLPAFVVMKNNVFQFAIIAACGNPVIATPTTKPPVTPPKPVSPPAPTPTPIAPVTPATPIAPTTQLVNTGAGSVSLLTSMFVATAAVASYGYRRYLRSRLV